MKKTAEKFLPYARQSIDQSDIEAVTEALQSDFITRGPKTAALEEAAAEYCGARFAVAFNSATSGLIAACHVVEANPGDRLVTTPNSFVATIAAGLRQGVEPLFIDIDPKMGNLDLDKLEAAEKRPSLRGRQIYLPVHFAGIPVDMRRLEKMIDDPRAVVIEDAAHAFGSFYPSGERVGSCAYSQMTVFSFHACKNITTAEGGLVTTNDRELYKRLLRFRNNGIVKAPDELGGDPPPWYYEVREITGNFHMSELQAALGLSQLKRVDQFADKRRSLWRAYRERLSDLPFIEPDDPEKCFLHLAVVRIPFEERGLSRKELMETLKERGIGTQVHYIPLYRHPFFTERRPDIHSYFPEMEAYYSEALTLPLFADMEEDDVDRVVSVLKPLI